MSQKQVVSSSPRNPFAPAERVEKKLKVLVYGESGAGKTWFGLTFPGRIAMIDCEGGSELYGGRDDIQQFDVLRTKSYEDVMSALEFIEADNGKTYQTVVIDPITVIWQILQEAAMLNNEAKVKAGKLRDSSLTYRDWGIIKRRLNRLYIRLTNLPCHVVVTSRLKEVFAVNGNDVVKVGVKPDSEKQTEYLFDIVLRLVRTAGKDGSASYHAITEKDRSGTLTYTIDDASFASLAHIAANYSSGQSVRAMADEEAASGDAEAMAEEEAEQETRKAPTNVAPKYQRPMAPATLCEFIQKRVNEVGEQNPDWEMVQEDEAQALAMDWQDKLGHNKSRRLAVVSFMLGEDVSTFKELTSAEHYVLSSWLSKDVENAHTEAQEIIDYLATRSAS